MYNSAVEKQSEKIPQVDAPFVARLQKIYSPIFKYYFRVSVHGIEHLPQSGRTLLIGNHSSIFAIDGMMTYYAIYSYMGRFVRSLMWDMLIKWPFYGSIGVRSGACIASPENALHLLENEECLLVYPGGVREGLKLYRDRYQLMWENRYGFIRTALKSKSPIVPVAFIGGEEMFAIRHKCESLARFLHMPMFPLTFRFPWLGPLGFLPTPVKCSIYFGEVIDFSKQYSPHDAENNNIVNQLQQIVKTKLEELIRQGLSERKSLWFSL